MLVPYLDATIKKTTSRSYAIEHASAEYTCLFEPLTDKEKLILNLLAEGMCNKAITHHTQLTINTIKWHLKNIYAKLNANNRTEAVLKAQRYSLLQGLT